MALDTELTNYWKLDGTSGNASDSVGSVTLTNSNVTYAAAKINNGAVFSGSDSRLYGTIADIDSYSDGWSCSFWAYADSVPNGRRWCWQINESSGWGTCFVGSWGTGDYSKLWFKFGTGESGYYGANSGFSIPNQTWFHVVTTVNGYSQKCYVNGTLVKEETRTANMANNSTTFSLGNDTGVAYDWVGKIDEVGIWTKELSQAEVSALYNGGVGLTYPFGTANLKTYNTNAKANIKTINTNGIQNVKTLNTNA